MNRFVAPQFIDVEDRIIGPITTRQFVLMIIGGVIIFLAYKFLDTAGFVMVALIVVGLLVLFGFVKINGRRFHEFVKSMIETLRRPRVRVWYKQVPLSQVTKKVVGKEDEEVKTDFMPSKKRIKPKSLRELSLIVDTGGKYQSE